MPTLLPMPTLSSFRQDTPESAMPMNSLPGLPTEIIIHIFKSMANFPTATAFSTACRRIRSIWQTNTATICHAILVDTITCVDHAFEYVKAQPSIHTTTHLDQASNHLKAQPLDFASFEKIRVKGLAVIEVTKQFCSNADTACLALGYYEDQRVQSVSGESSSPGSLSQAQRLFFLRAWYRIHVLASLSSYPLPCILFASFDLLEFKQMMEVFCWLIYCCSEDQRLDLHITYGMEGKLGLLESPIPPPHWHNLEACLASFSQDLIGHLLDYRWNKDGGIHFWDLLLREVHLNSTTLRKGVNWAEDSDISDWDSS